MSLSRRRFIVTLGGGLLATPLLARTADQLAPRLRSLSARADGAGRYFVTGLDAQGGVCFDLPLPGRGHGLAVTPAQDRAVLVARRPGNFLVVLDLAEGRVVQQLEGRPDRHFYGHAAYSADGRWLYTPENDYDGRRGVIGVRDVQQGYRWVREMPSHGVGPHDVKLLADGRTLVVANGGILTHPDTGRAKLNLDSMRPSLVYLDAATGALRERHELAAELQRNSIRHLAIGAGDLVCFVMQYQGGRNHRPPLVGLHRRGERPHLCLAPDEVQPRMHNYCGSVAADSTGHYFAVSSPRGNLVTFWSASERRLVAHTGLADGCGVATGDAAGEFLLSSGGGEMVRYRLHGRSRARFSFGSLDRPRWDNHMLGLDA